MLFQEEEYNLFVNDFNTSIYNLPKESNYSNYIFLCVGSDKIMGDSYGPLVGQKLEEFFQSMYTNVKVIGTLETPVSALNFNETVSKIYSSYKNPCVIVIDSALSKENRIGNIIVQNSKIQCGKGTNKQMKLIGDISIRAIVATNYNTPRYNYKSLQNVSLKQVLKLADITANGIYQVMKYH